LWVNVTTSANLNRHNFRLQRLPTHGDRARQHSKRAQTTHVDPQIQRKRQGVKQSKAARKKIENKKEQKEPKNQRTKEQKNK
jgi:hypothetical protein